MSSLISVFGFDCSEIVPAKGKSGGLVLMWNDTINVKVTISNDNFVNCLIFDEPDPQPWQFTFLYGPPIPSLRPEFWDSLTAIGNSFQGPWKLLGDFNALLSQEDKIGGRPVSNASNGGFRQFINNFGLIDLGFQGHPFTWSNRRSGSSNIQERLDRGIANAQWKMLFPFATIIHLTAIHSDHKPLLFNSNPNPHSYPKPFRFEAMWLDHPDTSIIIREAWSKGSSLVSKLKNTKSALRKWNKVVFGDINQKIQQLRSHIEAFQNQPSSPNAVSMEQAAVRNLTDLERREAIYWRERSKVRWAEDGDQNTHYFHITTLIHRKNNRINYIMNSGSTWISDRQQIGLEFETYFRHIFATVQPLCPSTLQDFVQPVITESINEGLTLCPSPLEVYQAVSSMGNYKSPGPDGMTVMFYKQYWGIIHEEVVKEVQDFFIHGRLKPAFNHTFIALIPKIKGASRVEQFRPIALCNIMLKIITKLIAGRLRNLLEKIVHPSQAAFIPHRAISDNIIINHEIMRYMHTKKGSNGFMAIKIDLAKAYDRVEWVVLRRIMEYLGFDNHFINLVMECTTTARFSLLLNGSPFGYFAAERGLRQGDPLSPALFTIFSDILSRMLAKAETEGSISGVKVTRSSPKITHLMYADDVVIYGRANVEEAAAVRDILQTYCNWTGQELNWNKSSVHFSSNVSASRRIQISGTLGMSECDHRGKYLGHSFCKFTSKTQEFNSLVEKISNKLAGWKKRSLSMAGRVTLLKSVIQSIPTFIMQTFLIPTGITTKLDMMMKDFLWGFDREKKHHLHLKSWKDISKPKISGGLGIRRIRDMNKALITKMNWQLCTDLNKPWVQLIRARYLRGRRRLDFEQTQKSSSWIWGGIRQCGELLIKGACYQLGRNSCMRIQEDPWIPALPNFKLPPDVVVPGDCFFVRDLMTDDDKLWNKIKISNLFPSDVCSHILNTPILDREQDTLVWTPSTSGSFSVKSAYRMIIQEGLDDSSRSPSDIFKMIWHPRIHGRHQLFLWKLIHRALPTRDKLRQFSPSLDPSCLICSNSTESVQHLFLECPVNKFLWLKSPWQLNLDRFRGYTVENWVLFLLGKDNRLPLEDCEKNRMLQYAVVLLELIWMERNGIWKGQGRANWNDLHSTINQTYHKYCKGSEDRIDRMKSNGRKIFPARWILPLRGYLKINFDAAFKEGRTVSGVILRNHEGIILKAWVNRFVSENPYCAETEAAIQALQNAEEMRLEMVEFEGDAFNVIMALNGLAQYEDWRAMKNLMTGRKLLSQHCLWTLKHVPRDCNACAHNLAKWASPLLMCGSIDVTTLPPAVWCDRGGT